MNKTIAPLRYSRVLELQQDSSSRSLTCHGPDALKSGLDRGVLWYVLQTYVGVFKLTFRYSASTNAGGQAVFFIFLFSLSFLSLFSLIPGTYRPYLRCIPYHLDCLGVDQLSRHVLCTDETALFLFE